MDEIVGTNKNDLHKCENVVCKRHEHEYGHCTFRCDIHCNLCKCQSSDLDDRFLDGKEESGRDLLLENTLHVRSSQRQILNTQVPLGNVKADVAKSLQCKSLPVLQSDISCEEFNLKMQCLVNRTTNHDRLYCNQENVMQVRRSCYHNQAAVSMELGNPTELPRVSGSDGLVREDGEAPDKPLDSTVLVRIKQFRAINKLLL